MMERELNLKWWILLPLPNNRPSVHIKFKMVIKDNAQVFIWSDNFQIFVVYDALIRHVLVMYKIKNPFLSFGYTQIQEDFISQRNKNQKGCSLAWFWITEEGQQSSIMREFDLHHITQRLPPLTQQNNKRVRNKGRG